MLLKEFPEPFGVIHNAFAERLRWTYARLNEIVDGPRNLGADSALMPGEALRTGPDCRFHPRRERRLRHTANPPPRRRRCGDRWGTISPLK